MLDDDQHERFFLVIYPSKNKKGGGSVKQKNDEGLPKAIDVFAGAGGLSLGAARAGFSLAAAVEIDVAAMDTHRKNFPHAKHIAVDASALSGKRLLRDAELKSGELTGLIGGPPCQGFSYMGKRELDNEEIGRASCRERV